VPVSSPAVAELAKLLENTFRHVNIALVNEMAMFAADLKVDVWEAIDAAGSKPFGFMPFRPGPGVGGHCLPIDPTYLSWQVKRRLGETFRFVELANDINRHMPGYVVRRVQARLNADALPLNGSRVLVLGLAYKPGTGDARETPSIPIVERLVAAGASVTAVDPHVRHVELGDGVRRLDSLTLEALRASDLVLIVTDQTSSTTSSSPARPDGCSTPETAWRATARRPLSGYSRRRSTTAPVGACRDRTRPTRARTPTRSAGRSWS
jgi:UDP-N-acetyl-D-glucosamine dehydrogenase